MPTILCYGDSNTWGHDPATATRLPRDERWPGVMRAALPQGWEVIEEALCGRTTVWDDPFSEGRNGLAYLAPCLASQAPLDLVLLMLGTNDVKTTFGLDAAEVASGAGRLARAIQLSGCGPGGAAPRVLLIAPPPLAAPDPRGRLWGFEGALETSRGLATHYRTAAGFLGCDFFDAGAVAAASPVDGVHLDAAAHRALGSALAERVRVMLGES